VHGGGLSARVNQLTHQRTNVDGWCTDGWTFFVPPCPWGNQGGELRLTFFFPSLSLGWSFWKLCFFRSPYPHLSLTYLPTFRLPAYAPWLSPSRPTYSPPGYLPTHPSAYLPPYPSTCLPLYLHTKFSPR
jgi:hypothetical protein